MDYPIIYNIIKSYDPIIKKEGYQHQIGEDKVIHSSKDEVDKS